MKKAIAAIEDQESISYVNEEQAAEIDVSLTEDIGFTVGHLMGMAGLSVASAIAEVYKPTEYNRVLLICGPGNNGGNGLVAARYLHHFGYKPCICYPECDDKPLYTSIVTQLKSLSVPFISFESLAQQLLNFEVVVDAVVGFSLQGNPRPPFDYLIHWMASISEHNQKPREYPAIVSVDIPSGWHAEDGDTSGTGLNPDMLVSLTAPKLCAKTFHGFHHFLGGRFVPRSIIHRFNLQMPPYAGTSVCIRIGKPPENIAASKIFDKYVEADPFIQFQKWLDHAMAAGVKEPIVVALSTASLDGKPSSRMVLLKKVDQGGFVWCSHYGSRKGRELAENPHASLLFYWNTLNRQIRVEGLVQRVSDEESDQYSCSRPQEIQTAPAISKQVLDQTCKELEKLPEGSSIPRQNWGGYRLIPDSFEFWQGDESSVHLRLQYIAENDAKTEWLII